MRQRKARSSRRIRVDHGIAHLKDWRASAGPPLGRREHTGDTAQAFASLLLHQQTTDLTPGQQDVNTEPQCCTRRLTANLNELVSGLNSRLRKAVSSSGASAIVAGAAMAWWRPRQRGQVNAPVSQCKGRSPSGDDALPLQATRHRPRSGHRPARGVARPRIPARHPDARRAEARRGPSCSTTAEPAIHTGRCDGAVGQLPGAFPADLA